MFDVCSDNLRVVVSDFGENFGISRSLRFGEDRFEVLEIKMD